MFNYPRGNWNNLNLDWFIQRFKDFLEEWQTAQDNIAGALDDEIDRAETALSDVYQARDDAAQSALTAGSAATNAQTAAAAAQQNSQLAISSASTAANKAVAAQTAESNAQSYASAANNSRLQAANSATAAGNSATAAGNSATAAANSETAAGNSATAAGNSATAAAGSALQSEGYALGKQNGTDVSSGTYYQNNSKYYSEQAASSAQSVAASAAQIATNADDITELKGAIDNLTELDFTTVTGYWGGGGGINSASATNKEVTTSFFPATNGQKFLIIQKFSTSRSGYINYCLRTVRGGFLKREVVTTGTTYTEKKMVVTVSTESSEQFLVSFSYRTFGESDTFRIFRYNDKPEYKVEQEINSRLSLLNSLSITEHEGLILGNGTIQAQDENNLEVYTDLYPINYGERMFYTLNTEYVHILYVYACWYDATKTFISRSNIHAGAASTETTYIFSPPNNSVRYVALTYYTYGTHRFYLNYVLDTSKQNVELFANRYNYTKSPIKSINHRGYNTTAPENTLPAFILSKTNGFDIVETDIRLTSDGIPVLLHDATINRTARNADGTEITSTINIADLTLAEAQTYDFGIWKGSTYAGTKIPTLEEFLLLCRKINLHAYLEIQPSAITTQEQVDTLFSIAKSCGMTTKITWLSAGNTQLQYVQNSNPTARIGKVLDDGYTVTMATLQGFKTDYNEFFIDAHSTIIDSAFITNCINYGIPLEMWLADSANSIINADPYISGFTSNSLIAEDVLYNSVITT